jgi:serine/threonine protein kinase
LPVEEVVALGLKLADALAHLHSHGLVHRDVKPSNILFVGGQPKLADAGLVAAVDDARSLVGTAGYIAPEGPGTPQADVYALGKVLYEAAFGKDRQEFPALPADVASRPDHARLLSSMPFSSMPAPPTTGSATGRPMKCARISVCYSAVNRWTAGARGGGVWFAPKS